MRRMPVLPSVMAVVLLGVLAASSDLAAYPLVGLRVAATAGEPSRPVLQGPARRPSYEHGEGYEPGDLTWPWNWGFTARDWIITVGFVAFLVLLAKWPGGARAAPVASENDDRSAGTLLLGARGGASRTGAHGDGTGMGADQTAV